MIIGKCTDAIRGIFLVGRGGREGRGLCGGNFPQRNFIDEENFHEGGAGFFFAFF